MKTRWTYKKGKVDKSKYIYPKSFKKFQECRGISIHLVILQTLGSAIFKIVTELQNFKT